MIFRSYEKHLAVNQRQALSASVPSHPKKNNQGSIEPKLMKGEFVCHEVKSGYVNILNKHLL